MNILIVNDDGYLSKSSHYLAQYLRSRGLGVIYCAPKSNQSGAGFSVSVGQTLEVQRKQQENFAIDGSPVDAVLSGLTIANTLYSDVDWVISGPNKGLNFGHCVNYSGTVSACREAFRLGKKSIAVSLAQDIKITNVLCSSLLAFLERFDAEIPEVAYKVCININVFTLDDVSLAYENEIFSTSFGLGASIIGPAKVDSSMAIKIDFPECHDFSYSGIMLGLLNATGLIDCNDRLFLQYKQKLGKIVAECFSLLLT